MTWKTSPRRRSTRQQLDPRAMIEGLESRLLLTASTLATIPNFLAHPDNPSLDTIDLTKFLSGSSYSAFTDQPKLVNVTVSGGSLSFSYASGQVGFASVAVTAADTDGSSVQQLFSLTVPPLVNPPSGPVANDDIAPPIIENTVSFLHPLFNDTDGPDGQGNRPCLAVAGLQIITQPLHGTVFLDVPSGYLTYTPDTGYTGPDSLQYNIGDNAGGTSNTATMTLTIVPPPAKVTIGTGAPRGLIYTEPDGTSARLILINGSAVITFTGGDIQQKTTAGFLTVTGPDATINDITITSPKGQFASMSMSARGGADHVATVGSISDTGAMLALIAPNTALTGNLTVGQVLQLQLASTNNSILTLGPAIRATIILIGSATDTTLSDGSSIRLLRSREWIANDGGNYSISAPNLFVMQIAGDFDDSLTLTGGGVGLNFAFVGGTVGASFPISWRIGGEIERFAAGSVSPHWSLVTDSLIASMHIGGLLSSNIAAAAFGDFTVSGGIEGAQITASAILQKGRLQFGRLITGGPINNSIIYSTGNMGQIIASSMTGTEISAGVLTDLLAPPGSLPKTITDFVSDATLSGVHLRTTFSNSKISAPHIGAVSLGTIQTSNGGIPQGLALLTMGALVARFDSRLVILGATQLRSPGLLSAYLTSKNIPLNDLHIDLITT